MKNLILALTCLTSSLAFAGSSLTCTGNQVIYLESVGDSGIAVPPTHAAVFLKDQLLERTVTVPGQLSLPWKTVSVDRSVLSTAIQARKQNTTVTVTYETLTLKRLDGQPLLPGEEATLTANVLCSDVNVFRPIP